MTNCMSKPTENGGPAPSRKAGKPEPGSREDRLAEALRANLRRRKAAARKPAGPTAPDDAPTAENVPEKPGKTP